MRVGAQLPLLQAGSDGPAYGSCSEGWHGAGAVQTCPAARAEDRLPEATCDAVQQRPGDLMRAAEGGALAPIGGGNAAAAVVSRVL